MTAAEILEWHATVTGTIAAASCSISAPGPKEIRRMLIGRELIGAG